MGRAHRSVVLAALSLVVCNSNAFKQIHLGLKIRLDDRVVLLGNSLRSSRLLRHCIVPAIDLRFLLVVEVSVRVSRRRR